MRSSPEDDHPTVAERRAAHAHIDDRLEHLGAQMIIFGRHEGPDRAASRYD
jgi:hypothetical protein